MAQYYTKQQLQGAGKYSGKCKIGNWNEDAELEEIVLKVSERFLPLGLEP
jgi:hypothetical protein